MHLCTRLSIIIIMFADTNALDNCGAVSCALIRDLNYVQVCEKRLVLLSEVDV